MSDHVPKEDCHIAVSKMIALFYLYFSQPCKAGKYQYYLDFYLFKTPSYSQPVKKEPGESSSSRFAFDFLMRNQLCFHCWLCFRASQSKNNMPNSDNNKLIATAVGAALAGAAVAVAAIKFNEHQKNKDTNTPELKRIPSRSELVFEDTMEDMEEIVLPHNHEEKMRRRIARRVAVEEDNRIPRRSVTVRVPATSANVGPGCKCSMNEMCMVCRSIYTVSDSLLILYLIF
jgi:hypothetical protein